MPTSLAQWLVTAALLLAGVIHLLPLSGLFGQARLRALYGIANESPDLVLLLQHRSVLFGLLGTYLVHAAFAPGHQPIALGAGLVSAGAFLLLARAGGGPRSPAVQRVVRADIVAVAALLAGTIARTCT